MPPLKKEELCQTMKLHIHPCDNDIALLKDLTEHYRLACNDISQYVFDHDCMLNSVELQKVLYEHIRKAFGLKSQFAISSIKTVTARYKTIETVYAKSPYKYQDEKGKWQFIPRDLSWLWKPILFSRPQADFVRNRDYSFVNGSSGEKLLSLNTLGKRIKVSFDVPECFQEYFDGTWRFGGGKIVNLLGEWYFHISMTRVADHSFDLTNTSHVVGIDRGLRFLAVAYDEKGKASFYDGRKIMKKRDTFNKVRAELQSKGAKSAKRALKRISGRENRWMTDVNHQISKALVQKYGADTLFVLEDLTGVSFDEQNLSTRTKKQRNELRSWAFYQLEQFLTYKAHAVGAEIIEVDAHYTSQRCPKCGQIHKENRHHETHEYICSCCGYRSNDDRIGAMNIQMLGTMYVSGDTNPRFGVRKEN